MKDGGVMAESRDASGVIGATSVEDKSRLTATVSDDRHDTAADEGRDDWNSNNNRDHDDRGTEREEATSKSSKSTRKGRNGPNSNRGRFPQDGFQQQGGPGPYQGGRAPYPPPAHHAPRGGAPYPHPPYGYAPAGAPMNDPYRGGPPPPPPPHYMPHQYGAPPGPYPLPGSGYPPPMSGPNYRLPPQYPPSHPYGGGGYHQGPSYPVASDSSSIASSKSKSSNKSKSKGSKKRTISGVHRNGKKSERGPYTYRSTDSNASSSSTVTAGNNTSSDTPNLADDSPKQRTTSRGQELPPMSSANLFEDERQLNSMHQQQHRRNHSAASTASSLSVGGFSLSSYEKPRGSGGNYDDAALVKASPKKRKSNSHEPVVHRRVKSNSSHSVDATGSSRFQKLSMDDTKGSASKSEQQKQDSRSLFLTMSTSPINCDVEATPSIKNTKKTANPPEVTKSNSFDRGGDTPTPTEAMAERDVMTNEHMLNQHLRSQSFTPLSHLENGSNAGRESSMSTSPTMANQNFPAIAPQLSWSIAGDAPSLADLTEWEEDINNGGKSKDHKRNNSSFSKASKGLALSPHSFGNYMDDDADAKHRAELSPNSDIVMSDESGKPGAAPLAVFLQHPPEERENVIHSRPRYASSSSTKKEDDIYRREPRSGGPQYGEAEHIHQMFLSNGGRSGSSSNNRWSSSDYGRNEFGMPPTPVYSEHREDSFGRSPMNADSRDGPPNYFTFGQNSGMHGHNDRVRNLRGRGTHNGPHAPMQIQVPPQSFSHHHNLTSPMGLGSNTKSNMWGHQGGWNGPNLHSPHHMPHVDLNSSKRKCLPLKPPIPSKFQGDIEKMRTAKVPEFANLVNFPNHMSQKQSVSLPDGMRCCVMCGQACPCSAGNKKKNAEKKAKAAADVGGLAPRNSNSQDSAKEKQSNGFAIIPTQNKGLCTLCDVNVWVVTSSGLEIKWCKGCKNFRPWAAFGDKGLATKCLRCRERQREKYALQKEEKERARMQAKGLKALGKSKA